MLYELNLASVCFRLFLAIVCGGIIGLERGWKKRPAGLRTHILVCIGATLTMMTGQYVRDFFGGTSDPARIGAQVVTGVGFLGAGTIMLTGKHQVKGLTTAAGLWASACMGLCIGIGFYMGAIVGCIFIFIATTLLHRIDRFVMASSKVLELYIDFNDSAAVTRFMDEIKQLNLQLTKIQNVGEQNQLAGSVGVFATLKLPSKSNHREIISKIKMIEGVYYVEEIY